jgi:hypothetical protein
MQLIRWYEMRGVWFACAGWTDEPPGATPVGWSVLPDGEKTAALLAELHRVQLERLDRN